jgi:hypothetical protein
MGFKIKARGNANPVLLEAVCRKDVFCTLNFDLLSKNGRRRQNTFCPFKNQINSYILAEEYP